MVMCCVLKIITSTFRRIFRSNSIVDSLYPSKICAEHNRHMQEMMWVIEKTSLLTITQPSSFNCDEVLIKGNPSI